MLNFTTIPTLKLSHLSEAEKRAYVLADNQLAELAGWDRNLLAVEFQELIDLGFDLELTGFESAAVDLILEDISDGPAGEDEVPLPKGPAVTRPGDIWQLDKHRLICGDARDPATYGILLPAKSADMVFADPPYNVPIDGHAGGLGRVHHADFAMACGEMDEAEFRQFLKTCLGNAANVSKAGAVHFVCMDWRHLFELIGAGREVYGALLNLCVWNKNNGGMGSFYRSKHELVCVFRVGHVSHVNNVQLGATGRYRTNVWDYDGVNTFRGGRAEELTMHPTVKPVALVADAIKDASKRGQLILDPFAGSGSTVIAAEQTGRVAAAIELNPIYADVVVRRWQNITGREATLRLAILGLSLRNLLRGSYERDQIYRRYIFKYRCIHWTRPRTHKFGVVSAVR